MQSHKKLRSYFTPIIAHRGASALAPENTLSAFLKAYEIGVKSVEFDVMLSADGKAIVIHDETLERTTNGRGLVYKSLYASLQKLDAGSWFSPIFTHEKIPSLLDVLQCLQKNKMAPNIEIKAVLGFEEETVKKTVEIIEQCWNNDIPILISSFSSTVRACLRRYSSSYLLGYLMDEWQADWKEESDKLDCLTINVNYQILDLEKVQEIKKTGKLLFAYTVDDAEIAKKLFSWGVDSLFSNCPKQMLEILPSGDR